MPTPRYLRSALATAGIALALIASPAAAQAQTARQILGDLAANQTHSWIDDHIGFDAMMTSYREGRRLYVTCGNVAEIGRRLLRQAGYPARVVQTLTLGEWDYMSDGHLMTEVFYGGRWQLYDPDANVRAVDANGEGVSVVTQVRAVQEGRAYWEQIADDALYREDEPDPTLRELARRIFTDPAGFYKRVMGIALLPRDPQGTVNLGLYYHDHEQATRLAGYRNGWRFLASDETWRTLTMTPDAPVTPTATPPAPSATTAVASAAVVSHPVRRHVCQRKWRRYQRTHSRRALVRYRRCVRTRR